MPSKSILIVNFGGPRSLNEVESFLKALLTDKDVIRTPFPQFFHNLLFNRVAKKRSVNVREDYEKIGGGSPIWSDTEYVAEALKNQLGGPIFTFHRYLPSTHAAFIEAIQKHPADEIQVFPLFPQFTYATTGSVARFFAKHLNSATLKKLRWVKSYPTHPAFIQATQNAIRDFLKEKELKEEETFFLFSAHGLPKKFIDTGDLYQHECTASFERVMAGFPKAEALLCYQSKFGRGEWLRPYTVDVCEHIEKYTTRPHCLFIPISFTSDHIETLFEVEDQYMPLIANSGRTAYRLPALGRRPDWLSSIPQILTDASPATTYMLIRP